MQPLALVIGVFFAIFLFLLYSGPAWPGTRGRLLPAIAASLSLAWNAGSLLILAWSELSPP